jgi:hypothetical protein
MILINSSHTNLERGLDAYFTPTCAVKSLINIEKIPKSIIEPACGNGAISKVLEEYGCEVKSFDIVDYGYSGTIIQNYLSYKFEYNKDIGIITNPPYTYAMSFIKKSIQEVGYVAYLLRIGFLESISRIKFFKETPPNRIWISSRRLPMMHRFGWTGNIAPSNVCFAWFIWDKSSDQVRIIDWFDWKDYE